MIALRGDTPNIALQILHCLILQHRNVFRGEISRT